MFYNNEKLFYRQITERVLTNNIKTPKLDEVEAFWTEIWSNKA